MTDLSKFSFLDEALMTTSEVIIKPLLTKGNYPSDLAEDILLSEFGADVVYRHGYFSQTTRFKLIFALSHWQSLNDDDKSLIADLNSYENIIISCRLISDPPDDHFLRRLQTKDIETEF